jgi:protocatechuate 3,4-dioxygenase beta subunit
VTFRTIVPGWYTPRAVHVHVRAFVSARDMITTQLYFPQSLINRVHSTKEPYKARGVSIYTNENDILIRPEDILKVSARGDGSLYATMTLGAGNA